MKLKDVMHDMPARLFVVVCIAVASDPEVGEYSEPTFLARLGRVPDYGAA